MADRQRSGLRLDARLAALLLRPATTTRTLIACIVGYSLLLAIGLTGLHRAENLFMDSTEAYGLGQQFLWGYGRHPPLTGWIAGVWYRVFPAADWASYALSGLMTAIALLSIYGIARRSMDARRAAFVVLALMLYPMFHVRANRFSNYQMLLALLPLLILVFLIAYEKRTVWWGALLGLAAAAVTLTIYSGLLGLLAIGVAALAHPGRAAFFRSPAPYVAAAVYGLAVAPHAAWLMQSDFASLRYAQERIGTAAPVQGLLRFLGHHAAYLAAPLAIGAIALRPWRRRKPDRRPAAWLVMVVAALLATVPPVLAFVLQVGLKTDWGNALFVLVPVALLATAGIEVTRRAVARIALAAGGLTLVLLAAAMIWPLVAIIPETPRHWAYSELARELTRVWRDRFGTPLPIVVGDFASASGVTFYSPDHPRMFVDFNPAFSPWIDFPTELRRKGFIGVCAEGDRRCLDYVSGLDAQAEKAEVTVTRMFGAVPRTLRYHLRIMGPQP